MSLFDENKAERKKKILGAARKLVVERGYAGLTMRDLAQAARVAVPTLYNLFGSKDAILGAELEAQAAEVAASLRGATGSFFARASFMFEAGMRLIEIAPEFYRACMQMFVTSPETEGMRLRIEAGYIGLMAANLASAKKAGQLADWADPEIVARHLYAQYMSSFLAWSVGELDMPSFRALAQSGMCHLLAGVARGQFADEVEAKLRSLPKRALQKEARRAASNVR